MKSWKLAVGAALFVASAATMAYTPGAGITGTPHDWSATNGTTLLLWLDSKGAQTTYNTGTAYIDPATGKQGTTKVTIGQCTKCHTPHQAKSTNLLWNHTLQAITYKWDDPATTAGTTYATFKGDTYKGPTTKCLSCHDGLLSSTDGMWFNRAFTSGSKYVAPAGSLNTGHEGGAGTVHANTARDVPARLEALAALGGVGRDALHAQLSGAVQVILHVHRGPGGRVLQEIAALSRADDGRTRVCAAVVNGVITEPGATVLSRMLHDRGVPAPW